MHTATSDELKVAFDEYLCRVQAENHRVIVTRDGKAVAAFIPIDDLESLLAIEDRHDRVEIEAALQESEANGYIAWDDVKAELGQ